MKDIFSLEGRKAIITGGGRGIGKAIAEGLMEFGAEAVLIGSSDSIFEAEKEFKAKGFLVHAVKGNFLDREERGRAFNESVALLGDKLDILVNNAGIQRRYPAESFPIHIWDEVLEINLTAVFDLSKRAVPIMKKNNYGKIINIGSLTSFRSNNKNVVAYQATKSAIRQITMAFAHEWSEYGIRSNAIAPGFITTNLTKAVKDDPKRYAETIESIPLRAWGEPDVLKGTAILLASSAGDYINGVTIPVDGGYLAV